MLAACENIDYWWIRAAHNENADATIIEPIQYLKQLNIRDMQQVEDGAASEAKATGEEVHK